MPDRIDDDGLHISTYHSATLSFSVTHTLSLTSHTHTHPDHHRGSSSQFAADNDRRACFTRRPLSPEISLANTRRRPNHPKRQTRLKIEPHHQHDEITDMKRPEESGRRRRWERGASRWAPGDNRIIDTSHREDGLALAVAWRRSAGTTLRLEVAVEDPWWRTTPPRGPVPLFWLAARRHAWRADGAEEQSMLRHVVAAVSPRSFMRKRGAGGVKMEDEKMERDEDDVDEQKRTRRHILSTGVNPSKRMPLPNTWRAAAYSAISAALRSGSSVYTTLIVLLPRPPPSPWPSARAS